MIKKPLTRLDTSSLSIDETKDFGSGLEAIQNLATKYFIHIIIDSVNCENGVPKIACGIHGGLAPVSRWIGEIDIEKMLIEIFEEVFWKVWVALKANKIDNLWSDALSGLAAPDLP